VKPVLVTLHAHPDDEAIFTGGTIVRAVQAGWRVVLIVATEGDRGQLPGGEVSDLRAHRRAETMAAAAILGVERVEFLGYGDSGCEEVSRRNPNGGIASGRGLQSGTLAAIHVDEAAAAVRRILVEEDAVAVTSYDDNGIYGHIDHVRVHEIAARSVEGTSSELYESTLDRGVLRRLRRELFERGLVTDLWPGALTQQLGVESGSTLVTVDVTGQLERKLVAVAAHSSQVIEAPSFMGLPPGVFHHLLRTEWFRIGRRGRGHFLDMLRATDGIACWPIAV
jgi:LmbE family N-acetylglucosaminyl deacetylase